MGKVDMQEYIKRSTESDTNAFRFIVEAYQPKIFSLTFRLMCHEEEAKDITQETFIKIWTNIKKYDSSKSFTTWVYRIATNLCLDELKSAKHRRDRQTDLIDDCLTQLSHWENGEKKLLNNELGDIIHSLTEKLTPKQRIVFTLRDIECLEIEEISGITSLSPQKIKSNLFLARRAIREKLKNI